MSSRISYCSEKNTLSVYHNKEAYESVDWVNLNKEDNSLKDTKIDFSQTGLNLALNKENNSFLGLKISNFLDRREMNYVGLAAEVAFKKILEESNIPCLYVGQGLNFQERNSEIKYCNKNIKIKRPDYLVVFPELGSILVDVKRRKRVKFQIKAKIEDAFTLGYEEIDNLYQLREYLNLPVWVAFTSDNKEFFMCQVKILKEIKDRFFESYTNVKRTKNLRISTEIMTVFGDNKLINPLFYFDMEGYTKALISLEVGQEPDLLDDEKE
ncbi:MAG: hypothetical protein K2Q03_09880 [Sphingobacteriaceae bacterium]|nr:hypothetical protein [Sphingobacteriaceae bacterium]